MGIQQAAVPIHWSYFLVFEDDVNALSRWIAFDDKNLGTYSIELARLLMTAAAEADTVAKLLCKQINPKAKADNINHYKSVLLGAVPMLAKAQVVMPAQGLTFTPWSNWAKKPPSSPEWWTANNDVKHRRGENFEKASLKNLLNATAGLLLLLVLYQSKGAIHLVPPPKHFIPTKFALMEGLIGPLSALRFMIPDGAKLPWIDT